MDAMPKIRPAIFERRPVLLAGPHLLADRPEDPHPLVAASQSQHRVGIGQDRFEPDAAHPINLDLRR